MVMFLFTLDNEIQKPNDLIQAVKEIGDWQGLCTNLGVDEGVIDTLINSPVTVDTKKADCLRAYFKTGEAKWSNVVKAVAMHPISNKRVTKQIAKAHGLNYTCNNIVKNEL
jgi:plasmid maintenance system antidote protein VapI